MQTQFTFRFKRIINNADSDALRRKSVGDISLRTPLIGHCPPQIWRLRKSLACQSDFI